MSTLHVVVPAAVADPSRPSGGNVYDRRLCAELASSGWTVVEHATDDLAAAMALLPDRAVVLVDGLLASPHPDIVATHADRLTVVVLVHLPIGVSADEERVRHGERAALRAARLVITTSRWTARWLTEAYGLSGDRIRVATPGADVTALPSPSARAAGGRLLCVGAVAPHKGQDVLVAALARLPEFSWHCTLAGSLDVDAPFARQVEADVHAAGLAERVVLAGALTGDARDAAYRDADLLVLPSRGETYGMVLTEALARGIPVVCTDVGGVHEALGTSSDGRSPGLLVPAGDARALADALQQWLTDAALRDRLRRRADERRRTLAPWSQTAAVVARALETVAA